MRTSIIWSAVTILLLAASMAATPALDDQTSTLAVAQEEDGNRGNDSDGDDEDNPGQGNGRNDDNDDEDEDGNRGHGNDSDGHDEDNPGQGNGRNDDEDDDDNGDGGTNINVANAGEYMVEVACELDAEANQTECIFTGVAPEGGKDFSHIDLPEEAVCTDVIDGNHEYVDSDPNTGVTGYKSKGGEGSFTLVLDGEVTVAGSTTYWFKVSGEVFPATGPGLRCGDLAAENSTLSTPTSELASTPAVDTGTLVVNTYQCADVPADTDSFDWFGECDPTGGVHEFTLAQVDTDTDDARSEESGVSGSVAFDSLAPGTYHLEIVDTKWCHAESDNVTAGGDVVIEAGQPTTVWGFVCDDGTVK